MLFVHLHNHTEYSLLDGAMKIDRLTELAAKYKMSAVAITDHGNMFGAIEFYKSAHRHGVKPIIGMETYIAPRSRKDRSKNLRIPESSFHMTLLCKDETGYRNLIRLSSIAFLEGFYYKPRIDKEILARHSAGLIGLSGCLKGEVPYLLGMGAHDEAKKALLQYQEIFGRDDFYVELIRLGVKREQAIHTELIGLAKECDAPLVATNDCHYFFPEDYKAHDVLLCIGTKKTLSDRERLRFETRHAYFRTSDEMAKLFDDLPEAVSNTGLVAEKCNLRIDTSGKDVKLPTFPRPQNFTSDFEYLKYLAFEGVKRRYERTPGIEERLNYELSIIKKMGLSGYFLIVREIIQYARENAIPVGPGRGSAVGSLTLYALGITDVDPLQYNLIFERFLNPERLSLPDIDADFGDSRRDEVIEFIRQRYGEKNVTQVITFGTMQARAVLRDVGRVMGIPYSEIDRIAKLIPFQRSIDEALNEVKELRLLIASKDEYQELVSIARKLEGLARHPATHAAGVVITPKELVEYVPLYKSPDRKEISTQYAKNSLEDIGILKMDILGLRTLTVIDNTLKLIGRQIGDIPIYDKDTYEMLKQGETVGVFQLESQGMQEILRSFKPENFEDLIAVIALYRPGPMGNVNLQKMIENKNDPNKVKYLHPLLEPILKETHGMIVYQEQVMRIASAIAGFSMAEADNLRRAMGKKIPELMAQNREKFIQNAQAKGVAADVAETIFNKVAPFAGYGFNKSHAAAYAALANQTAYLKCHFKQEFMISSLNSELHDTKRLWVLIREARRMDMDILAPDINKSDYEFKKEEQKIRYGLGALKNLGRPMVEAIHKERERGLFSSFFDFQTRTKGLNKKSLESLIKAGAFRELEPDTGKLLKLFRRGTAHTAMQGDLFPTDAENNNAEADSEEAAEDTTAGQKEAFGFYFSEHPLEHFHEEISALDLVSISSLDAHKSGEFITIGGLVSAKKIKKDKKGRNYAIVNVEDFDGAIDIFIFSDNFEKYAPLLTVDTPLIIRGRVSGDEERKSVRAEQIIPLKDARNYYKKVVISLDRAQLPDRNLKDLQKVLDANKGSCEVWFKINGKMECRNFRSRSIRINPAPEVLDQIKGIVGPSSLHIYGSI